MFNTNIDSNYYSKMNDIYSREKESIEILINIHYELSDIKQRLEGQNMTFLQKMLQLSEMEIQMRMESMQNGHY